MGANAGNIIVTIGGNKPNLTVVGPVDLKSGQGGRGGQGGDTGNANSESINGGAGAAAGAGGQGGHVNLTILRATTTFTDRISMEAGQGGQGGRGGLVNDAGKTAGQGGDGGDGGNVSLVANQVIFKGDQWELISGDGPPIVQALSAADGLGGNGGSVSVIIKDNLIINNDAELRFTRGADRLKGQGGVITFKVNKNLEIAANQTLTMSASGTMEQGQDQINFHVLSLKPRATFVTQSQVDGKANGQYYNVDNLDVLTEAKWLTNGVYQPNNENINQEFIRFDLTNVKKADQQILALDHTGYDGQIDLSHFDPVKQQAQYLVTPGQPGFIVSNYETKARRLGNVILADRTTGAVGGAHVKPGTTEYIATSVEHFAFTGGLRRYYWQVFVDSLNKLGVGQNPLVAYNFKTADASRVMAQSALGGLLIATNAFEQATIKGIDQTVNLATVSKPYLSAIISAYELTAKTGSQVRVNALAAALTLAKKTEMDWGTMTTGLFMEFGTGDYKTDSIVTDYGQIKGKGDSHSVGGGLFLKSQFNGGTFLEASARGGMIDNDFKVNQDPWLKDPKPHAYDSSTNYFGLHAGLGHNFKINETGTLSPFGQVFWTRVGRDQFVTKFGDHFKINRIDSLKTRLGVRLAGKVTHTVRGYLATAWDHESKGLAKGQLFQDPITHPPSLKGHSLHVETGFSLTPADSPVSLEGQVFAQVGRQRGVGGSLGLKVEF
jgi:hypothetical protein